MGDTMRMTRILAALALMATVAPTVASAQDEDRALKPEVMLLLDASWSMQRPGLAPPEDGPALQACIPRVAAGLPAIPPQGNRAQISRMGVIKQALAGSAEPLEQAVCIAEAVQIDPDLDIPALGLDAVAVNNRTMCCAQRAGPACVRWAPCGADSAEFDDAVAAGPNSIRRDGLIHANETRVKFGLMVSDSDPAVPGSYGTEQDDLQVPADIANQNDILASGANRPNLGVRPPTAAGQEPRAGDLIPGNRGVLNDGNLRPDVAVGEDADSVRRHNAMVMQQLRSVVPEGPSPLAAMLHDLDTYYTDQSEGPEGVRDEAFACRRRVAVLFTDGGSSHYYRDPAAVGAGNPCVGDCGREGFPYLSSEQYAATLAARNIPLYVVAFDGPDAEVDKARSVARAAALEAGADDETDFFFTVDSPEAMREALTRIAGSALAGLRSKTTPLVVTPGDGDVDINEDLEEVRQIRLVSFSEVSPDDGGRYGRIAALQYGCVDGQDGDEEAPGELEFLGGVFFDEALAQQSGRTAVGGSPIDGDLIQAVGGDAALFDENGAVQPNDELDEDQLRDLADAPRGDGAANNEDPLADVVNVLEGFVGSEGQVANADGEIERGERQLGEIFDGDLIAVPPPRLAVDNPAFRTYARDRRNRPTLIAAGARDGQIHFFRLADALEVFTFIPRLSWRNLRDGVDNPGLGALNADGPLVYAEVARCRSLDDGAGDCPAEDGNLEFHTMVVGGLGGGGSNLFGVDISDATEALAAEDPLGRIDGNAVRAWDLVNAPELEAIEAFDDNTRQDPGLGLTLSRPLVTHVRIDDQVRAVAVVGCGDDRNADRALNLAPNIEGRCVLVVDAVSGEVLRRFQQNDGVADGSTMNAPMIGTPVGFPAGGLQPADRVYIGDRVGRLWRMDLRSERLADWSMSVVWPPEDAEDAQDYELGRPVVDRPSISLRPDGRLVVVFGTGADPRPVGDDIEAGPPAHVVSFTEQVVLADDEVDFQTETNWVMPLRENEYLTGAPLTQYSIVYFTTIEEVEEQACGNQLGRLYGVHYTRTEENPYRTEDGRALDVVPGLPTFITEAGERVEDAISIRMPPGRTAHGLAVATAPACGEGQGSRTQLVVNLSDESQGSQGQIDPGGARVERKTGELVPGALDQELFGSDDLGLALDLDGVDGQGNRLGNGAGAPSLFPRESVYWGTTFAR